MPKHFFTLVVVAFLIFGCNSKTTDKQSPSTQELLPKSEGHPGELLVVLTPEQEKSNLGDAVIESFQKTYYVITPQPEPVLTTIIKTPEQYRKFFSLYRNVLRINIGHTKNHEKPKIKLYRDLDARDQLVFELVANSRTKAAEYLKQKKQYIIDIIEDQEIERLQKNEYAKYNQAAMDLLAADYAIHLQIPQEFQIAEQRPDFIWLKIPTQQLEQDVTDNAIISRQDIALEKNIFIYTYPYENDSTFTPQFLMAKRDTVLKYNVPGNSLNTYMGTEYGYGVEPRYKEITHNGAYAFEIKGIWKLINGFMGGPFVSLTQVDEATNRIVTVEGNVYAPHTKKRELIRSMEAIVKTLSFDEEKQ